MVCRGDALVYVGQVKQSREFVCVWLSPFGNWLVEWALRKPC